MGLEVGGKGDTKEKKKEEEKIPHMCESIGHRPLRGRCPKGRQINEQKKCRSNGDKGDKTEDVDAEARARRLVHRRGCSCQIMAPSA